MGFWGGVEKCVDNKCVIGVYITHKQLTPTLEGGTDMKFRKYNSFKEMPNNLRMVCYVAILQACIGLMLLIMNMMGMNDLPTYVPLMFITVGSVISNAVMRPCSTSCEK